MAGNSRSGRRPQPTALKLLRGNPGKRPINDKEPQIVPVTEAFDAIPAEIAGDLVAASEWARLAPILRNARIVTEAERSVLLALCQQWSRYLEAQAKVASLGMVVKGANGQPLTNPYLTVADKALNHCCRLWVELGLTPSVRSKMAALPEAERPDSKWAGIL